jgi:hypothetical protein
VKERRMTLVLPAPVIITPCPQPGFEAMTQAPARRKTSAVVVEAVRPQEMYAERTTKVSDKHDTTNVAVRMILGKEVLHA